MTKPRPRYRAQETLAHLARARVALRRRLRRELVAASVDKPLAQQATDPAKAHRPSAELHWIDARRQPSERTQRSQGQPPRR